MRIHHLNCGSMCPVSARLVNGQGSLLGRGRMVCHCLLIESDSAGLILVDTGIGTLDCQDPSHFPGLLKAVAKPSFDLRETAISQVMALGFSARDVRHIVVTHLDLDHAGGFPDFPEATVHVHAIERERAFARATLPERHRYLPSHWGHGVRWETYSEQGERWFGFESVRALVGLPAHDVLLVPLFGHTPGHCAVAVRAPSGGWLLHCGDAYFHHREVDPHEPGCPPGLRLFQAASEWNRSLRLANQARLRRLAAAHSDEVRLFCAHDPAEFDALLNA